MGRKGLLIKQFLNNAFVTTAIVLIVLSVVALWYDGTMICISTINTDFGDDGDCTIIFNTRNGTE